MSDADIPFQALHVAHFKHILHQTVGLALPEVSTVNGHDPGGILSPVQLQHRQGVVEGLIDGVVPTIPTIPHMSLQFEVTVPVEENWTSSS